MLKIDSSPAAQLETANRAEEEMHRQFRHTEREDGILKPTAEKCGAPITTDEVREVLYHLPLGKAPGSDGIPNKVYRTHSEALARILTVVFNHAREGATIPPPC